MQLPGIPGIIFSALLLSGPTARPERAGAASSAKTVEIEVIEGGASAAALRLTAPVEGKIGAHVDAQGTRQCQVEVHAIGEGHHLELRCAGGQGQELRVEAKQAFVVGQRVMLAEVKRAQGSTTQVFVTLR